LHQWKHNLVEIENDKHSGLHGLKSIIRWW